MAVNKHLDAGGLCLRSIVDELLPEHIRTSKPKLVSMLKLFADYLEHEHKSGYYANRIQEQRDLDTIEEEFFIQIQKEIGAPIPQTFAADPRLFYKQIRDLYISRGTKDSIDSFFRLLFNDDVEVYYPNNDLFAPSDGKWNSVYDQVVADKDVFNALFTYTLTQPTTVIEGVDDVGAMLTIDNPIVFVNNQLRNDYTIKSVINEAEARLESQIVFDSEIGPGTVEIYAEGIFTTQDGFVSDLKILQDSFYYQKYSYVLRTGTDINLWKSAFNRLIHPAGFIFFGEIFLFLNAVTRIPDPPGFQTGGDPIPIVIPRTLGKGAARNDVEREFEMHLRVPKGSFGAAQYLDQIKFMIDTPLYAFEEYTIEEAINKAIDIKIGSEVTTEITP